MHDRVLTIRIPESGIAPALLAQPLQRFGIASGSEVNVVRIEAEPHWQWRSHDAAFLWQLVGHLERIAEAFEPRSPAAG